MSATKEVKLYRYRVRCDRPGEGWAVVVLGSDGFFSTVSDWGNYAYWWSHHGEPDFRLFIHNLMRDPHYAATKLGGKHSRVYDGPETVKAIKQCIIERRMQEQLTAEEAREEWERIDGNIEDDEAWFGIWWSETKLEDAHELRRTCTDRQLLAFCERVLPRLWDLVRAELVAEGLLKEEASAHG